jgi:hypothetical protein
MTTVSNPEIYHPICLLGIAGLPASHMGQRPGTYLGGWAGLFLGKSEMPAIPTNAVLRKSLRFMAFAPSMPLYGLFQPCRILSTLYYFCPNVKLFL